MVSTSAIQRKHIANSTLCDKMLFCLFAYFVSKKDYGQVCKNKKIQSKSTEDGSSGHNRNLRYCVHVN